MVKLLAAEKLNKVKVLYFSAQKGQGIKAILFCKIKHKMDLDTSMLSHKHNANIMALAIKKRTLLRLLGL